MNKKKPTPPSRRKHTIAFAGSHGGRASKNSQNTSVVYEKYTNDNHAMNENTAPKQTTEHKNAPYYEAAPHAYAHGYAYDDADNKTAYHNAENNPVDKHIGSQLAALRADYGMSQMDLAIRTQNRIETIIAYENGTQRMSAYALKTFAECFDLPAHMFLPQDGQHNPDQQFFTHMIDNIQNNHAIDCSHVHVDDVIEYVKNFLHLTPLDRANLNKIAALMAPNQ